jgi:hypothetical protein
MKALALVAFAVVSCTSPPPTVATPSPTAEPGVLAVTALLDLSGPRAAIGAQQKNALQLWVDVAQARASVAVKLRTVDIAGSDAKLLIELRRAAVDDLADAVIVGAPVTYDETLGRAIGLASLPVVLTQPLAADPAGRLGGHWAFALSPLLPQLAAREIDDAMRRGVLVPSLVLADGRDRVDPMAAALAAELERRRLDPLTRIAMPSDWSVLPVVRSSLSVLRSVHCTSLPGSCAAVAQMAVTTGAPTFFYLSYLTTPADLGDHRDLAARAIFPASRTILPFDSPPTTATNQMRDRFLRAFAERHGAAGAQSAIAYDAIALLAAAADRAGPDDRTALRDALERITMPLIASTYTFSALRHAGSDPDDIAYLRWAGAAVAPALAPSLGTGIGAP